MKFHYVFKITTFSLFIVFTMATSASAMLHIEKSATRAIHRFSTSQYILRQPLSEMLFSTKPCEKIAKNYQTRSFSINREQVRVAYDAFGQKLLIAFENIYVPNPLAAMREYIDHRKKRASPLRPWYCMDSGDLEEMKEYTALYFEDMNFYPKSSIFYETRNEYLKELALKSWSGLDTQHNALKSKKNQSVAMYLLSLAETHDFVFLTRNNIVQSFESIIQTYELDDQKWDDIVLPFVRFLCRPGLHPEYKMSADDFESSLKKLRGAHEKERLHKLREIYYDDYEYTLVNWLKLGSPTV